MMLTAKTCDELRPLALRADAASGVERNPLDRARRVRQNRRLPGLQSSAGDILQRRSARADEKPAGYFGGRATASPWAYPDRGAASLMRSE